MQIPKTFNVVYMGRQNGACGVFYEINRQVEANNATEAKRIAFDELHENGYETNYCVRVDCS